VAAAGTGSVVTPPALVAVDVAAGCVALLTAAGAPVITSAVGAAGAGVAMIIVLLKWGVFRFDPSGCGCAVTQAAGFTNRRSFALVDAVICRSHPRGKGGK